LTRFLENQGKVQAETVVRSINSFKGKKLFLLENWLEGSF
jgi:hypothetical protein